MPDRLRWGGWDSEGRGQPPWWPEGETWPPREEAWRVMRRRFMLRVAVFGVVAVLFLMVLAGLIVWFLATQIGGHLPNVLTAIVVLIVVVLLARRAIRGVRGSVAPAADLIEAAGRVEEGDFSARVPERGPREVRALARAFNDMSSRLEAGDRDRRQLLADVSHELRTPLAVIRGNLEGIIDGLYPADAAHLATILDETQLLERLVEDLRTLSLSDAGALPLHREATDLGELLDDVAAALRTEAETAGVSVAVEADPAVGELEVDQLRMREVLGNLARNALRYTERGGRITLSTTGGEGLAVVEVSDTGKGIEPDALYRIFDRFYRGPDSPGSGLGLAIAKSLVEAHGGRISASSEPGRGTTIRVELPRGAA